MFSLCLFTYPNESLFPFPSPSLRPTKIVVLLYLVKVKVQNENTIRDEYSIRLKKKINSSYIFGHASSRYIARVCFFFFWTEGVPLIEAGNKCCPRCDAPAIRCIHGAPDVLHLCSANTCQFERLIKEPLCSFLHMQMKFPWPSCCSLHGEDPKSSSIRASYVRITNSSLAHASYIVHLYSQYI